MGNKETVVCAARFLCRMYICNIFEYVGVCVLNSSLYFCRRGVWFNCCTPTGFEPMPLQEGGVGKGRISTGVTQVTVLDV